MRLTPRARSARIEGVVKDADGQVLLKVAVTAPPAEGKANAALVALLAEVFDVPRGAVSLLHGTQARRKLVFIAGDAQALGRRLDAVVAG